MNNQVVAKVLGYRKSERYADERTLQTAWNDLINERPGHKLTIVEVRDVPEILKYTPVFAFASLVINEKLVCIGRCPKKDEVVTWLRVAIMEMSEFQEEGNLRQERNWVQGSHDLLAEKLTIETIENCKKCE